MWSNSTKGSVSGTVAPADGQAEQQVPTMQPDAPVDPRVEFANQLIAEATHVGYRDQAVFIIRRVMPEYRPEHPSLAHAKAYASRQDIESVTSGPGTYAKAEQMLVAAYLAGVDKH